MIITSDPVTVTTNVPKAKRASFSVKADGKLFAILTKNLYANPVLSTLSELGQNAWDAHKRANRADQPFTVTLPNHLSPILIVRDLGLSMAHDFVMDDYCTAFESSKDTDSEQSGGFGVGRLASLALSNTYNIACYQGGTKRTYVVFLNGDGVPEINHVATVATTEPDGTEVSVPIQEKDINAFEDAAKRAYRFYNPKPVIKGCSRFAFYENQITLTGTNWAIDNSIGYPVAVGGVYWYKIEAANLRDLTEVQRDLLASNLGLVLHFNASEIHPQANRQGLFYNDVTIAAIKTRLDAMEQELKDAIQRDFDKCASIVEAKRLWISYFYAGGPAYKLGRVFGDVQKVYWKGHPIHNGDLHTHRIDPNDTTRLIPIDGIVLRAYSVMARGRRGRAVINEIGSDRLFVHPENRLFLNDLDGGRGGKRRIGFALRQSGTSSHSNRLYYSIRFKTPQAEAAFHALNHTDASIFESAAAIIVPATANGREGGADNEKHKLKVFQFNAGAAGSSNASDYWTPTEIDVDEGGVYTTIYRFNSCDMDNHMLCHRLALMREHSLIGDVAIYGIKTTQACGKSDPAVLAELRASEDWIELRDWIAEERAKLLPAEGFNQILADGMEHAHSRTFEPTKWAGTVMQAYLDKAAFIATQNEHAEKHREKIDAFKALGGQMAYNRMPTATYDMAAEWAKIIARYPLFNKIIESYQTYFGGNDTALCADYVATVELAHEALENRRAAAAIEDEIAA